MAKLDKALFGLSASGSISGVLTYLKRMRHQIVEKKPELKDPQTHLQLDWRHMFNKAVALWHTLSAAEKNEWESAARPKHMTGYAWFISQALRPNPGIYLPLQGGTMQGIIQMDGYPIQTLKDPVAAQDGDTKAARDAAIAAAIGGSLICDIYGYDGANWQKLLVESAAQHNLRVRLYVGATPIDSGLQSSTFLVSIRALNVLSALYAFDGVTQRRLPAFADNADNLAPGFFMQGVQARLMGFDGSNYDRLRTYPTGILKVGRAQIGLSDTRRVAIGQVKAAPGDLYWMVLNPSAGNSLFELTDDLDGLGAVVLDHFDTTRDGHMMTFDPPMEFSTGIYLKTITNLTSIIFGYK